MGKRVVDTYDYQTENTNSKLFSWNVQNFRYSTNTDTLFSKDNIMTHPVGYNEEKVIELDKKLSLVEQSQNIMSKEVSEIKEDVKAIDKKLDAIVERLSDKFAAKRVETAMKRLITAVCGWVVTAVLALVINKP